MKTQLNTMIRISVFCMYVCMYCVLAIWVQETFVYMCSFSRSGFEVRKSDFPISFFLENNRYQQLAYSAYHQFLKNESINLSLQMSHHQVDNRKQPQTIASKGT